MTHNYNIWQKKKTIENFIHISKFVIKIVKQAFMYVPQRKNTMFYRFNYN